MEIFYFLNINQHFFAIEQFLHKDPTHRSVKRSIVSYMQNINDYIGRGLCRTRIIQDYTILYFSDGYISGYYLANLNQTLNDGLSRQHLPFSH